MTAIVGPNGSGKTTLPKALSGDCRITGSVSHQRPRRRGDEAARGGGDARRAAAGDALAFPFTVREIVGSA